MGLIMNVYRDSVIPFTQFGGTSMSSEFPNFNREENWLAIYIGEGGFADQTSMPDGNYPPVTWKLPLKAGAISSRNKLNGSGNFYLSGSLGAPISVTFSGSGTISQAEGSLLAFLVANLAGSGTMTASAVGGLFILCDLYGYSSITADLTDGITRENISASLSGNSSLTATIAGGKYVSVDLVGSADLEGALGALAGAICNMIGTGSLSGTPGGIGHMTAEITPFTTLSPQSLAASVWNSIASSYNATGTFGEKLNDAGSASNPWTEIIEGGYTASDILKIISSVLAGKTTITDLGGGNATVTFRDINDTVDRVTATMDGSERTDVDKNVI